MRGVLGVAVDIPEEIPEGGMEEEGGMEDVEALGLWEVAEVEEVEVEEEVVEVVEDMDALGLCVLGFGFEVLVEMDEVVVDVDVDEESESGNEEGGGSDILFCDFCDFWGVTVAVGLCGSGGVAPIVVGGVGVVADEEEAGIAEEEEKEAGGCGIGALKAVVVVEDDGAAGVTDGVGFCALGAVPDVVLLFLLVVVAAVAVAVGGAVAGVTAEPCEEALCFDDDEPISSIDVPFNLDLNPSPSSIASTP